MHYAGYYFYSFLEAMRFHFISAILLLVCISISTAQETQDADELSSPISPGQTFYRFRLGGFLGAGPAMQSGEFKTTSCDCPAFTDGGGYSLISGGIGEYCFTDGFSVGIMAALDFRTINALYREYESVRLKQTATGESIDQRVQFRHTVDVSSTSLMISPFLKFYPVEPAFIRTGIGFNFGLSSSLQHQKELLDKTARLPNGEETEISLDRSDPRVISGTKALIQDSEMPLLKNPALYWNIALGADFKASKKILVGPAIQYSLPISDLSASGNAFRIANWSFLAEVKVKIH